MNVSGDIATTAISPKLGNGRLNSRTTMVAAMANIMTIIDSAATCFSNAPSTLLDALRKRMKGDPLFWITLSLSFGLVIEPVDLGAQRCDTVSTIGLFETRPDIPPDLHKLCHFFWR